MQNKTPEIINHILSFYQKLGKDTSFINEFMQEKNWEEYFYLRLQRALMNDVLSEGQTPAARYAIWASNVQMVLKEVETAIKLGRISEAEEKIRLTCNVVGAFKDAQIFIDSVNGMCSVSHHQLFLSYIKHQLEQADAKQPAFDKEGIIELLKQKYCEKTSRLSRRLGLPRDIDFSLKNRVLVVHIKNPLANMQTNEAAFEAWIIVLKVWLGDDVEWVFLDYSVPKNISNEYTAGYQRGHYNRFLFRINGFIELFGDWFVLAEDKQNEVTAFMAWFRKGPSLLNHPLKEAKSVIKTEKMERQIESWLTFEGGKALLCSRLCLNQNKVFNQLPVGVFHERIAAPNAIFSRGASAIDLWGIGTDGKTLHLIELKCGNNKGMGIISETLFYAYVMYQACVDSKGCIAFGTWGKRGNKRGIELLRGHKYPQMALHFMAEQFHPLFDEQVCMLLNESLSAWNASADQVRYDYQAKEIKPI